MCLPLTAIVCSVSSDAGPHGLTCICIKLGVALSYTSKRRLVLPMPLCSSHTSCGVYTCSSLIHTADVQTVVPVDVFWFLEIINNQEIRQTHHFSQQIIAISQLHSEKLFASSITALTVTNTDFSLRLALLSFGGRISSHVAGLTLQLYQLTLI